MEYNQNRIAAINHQRAYRSSSMIILDFFISRRKNWLLFTGYFGSWGHALVAVAVVETFKQESSYRLSLETENSDRCREI